MQACAKMPWTTRKRDNFCRRTVSTEPGETATSSVIRDTEASGLASGTFWNSRYSVLARRLLIKAHSGPTALKYQNAQKIVHDSRIGFPGNSSGRAREREI